MSNMKTSTGKSSRKALRNRYRKGNQHGRSWTDEFGMPLSFRQWLKSAQSRGAVRSPG